MAGRQGQTPAPPTRSGLSILPLTPCTWTLGLPSSIVPTSGLLPPRVLQTALQALSWQLQGSWEPSPLSRAGNFLFIALTLYLGVLLLSGCETYRR